MSAPGRGDPLLEQAAAEIGVDQTLVHFIGGTTKGLIAEYFMCIRAPLSRV